MCASTVLPDVMLCVCYRVMMEGRELLLLPAAGRPLHQVIPYQPVYGCAPCNDFIVETKELSVVSLLLSPHFPLDSVTGLPVRVSANIRERTLKDVGSVSSSTVGLHHSPEELVKTAQNPFPAMGSKGTVSSVTTSATTAAVAAATNSGLTGPTSAAATSVGVSRELGREVTAAEIIATCTAAATAAVLRASSSSSSLEPEGKVSGSTSGKDLRIARAHTRTHMIVHISQWEEKFAFSGSMYSVSHH